MFTAFVGTDPFREERQSAFVGTDPVEGRAGKARAGKARSAAEVGGPGREQPSSDEVIHHRLFDRADVVTRRPRDTLDIARPERRGDSSMGGT